MSIFLDIEPVPFRLLDDLMMRMEANNDRLRERLGEKGSTERPTPRRAAHNAEDSTYRRPEPAASPRGTTLAVYWLYFGGDGRLWVASATGAGGWGQMGRHFEPYDLRALGVPQFDPVEHFLATRDEIPDDPVVANIWANRIRKTWSPQYGSKGDYGDWYDMRQSQEPDWAIRLGVTYPMLRVHYETGGGEGLRNDANFYYVATGGGTASVLSHTVGYTYDSTLSVKVWEQITVPNSIHYWADVVQPAASDSDGPYEDHYAYSLSPSGMVGASSVGAGVLGLEGDVTLGLGNGDLTVYVSDYLYGEGPQWNWATGLLNHSDPNQYNWGEFGWQSSVMPGYTSFDHMYRAFSPWFVDWLSPYIKLDVLPEPWNDPAAMDAYLRTPDSEPPQFNSGPILRGGGPYSFVVPSYTVQAPQSSEEYNEAVNGIGASRGFNVEAFGALPLVEFKYATPAHLLGLAGESEGGGWSLVLPTWQWSPDTTRGGFATLLGFEGSQIAATQALMSSGRLAFRRSDGRRASLRVGGSLSSAPDSDPDNAAAAVMIASDWGQSAAVKQLARRFGLR